MGIEQDGQLDIPREVCWCGIEVLGHPDTFACTWGAFRGFDGSNANYRAIVFGDHDGVAEHGGLDYFGEAGFGFGKFQLFCHLVILCD